MWSSKKRVAICSCRFVYVFFVVKITDLEYSVIKLCNEEI